MPPELADAIALALALDQEERPETALLLAEAITSGARGVEPSPNGARTRTLGGTAATRVLVGTGRADGPDPGRAARHRRRPTAPTPIRAGSSSRAGRPIPRRCPATAPTRAAARRRSARAARATARRFFAFLAVVVLFVAAVAVAVTIAASSSNNVVHYRKVVAHDASDAVKQLQSIISQYTK